MNADTQNKRLIPASDLPITGDTSQKVIKGRISGFRAGFFLASGAVVGCFALALWNRKAISALLLNRGQRRELPEAASTDETDAIY